MAESFWSTLKTEFYDRKKWRTRNEAQKAVARWIEIAYNRRRRHSSIGMVSPVDFEAQLANQNDNKKAVA